MVNSEVKKVLVKNVLKAKIREKEDYIKTLEEELEKLYDDFDSLDETDWSLEMP